MEPERVCPAEWGMPYLTTKPFNWYEAPDNVPSQPRLGHLRVVWAYPFEAEPEAGATGWRDFLYWTSLEVLKTWSLFFSTIELRHPVLWGVRVTMGHDGVEVTQAPREETRRDSWMYA